MGSGQVSAVERRLVVDKHDGFITEAKGFVTPVRPAGQFIQYRILKGLGKAVIDQPYLQVHGGTDDQVRELVAGKLAHFLVKLHRVEFPVVQGDSGMAGLKCVQ